MDLSCKSLFNVNECTSNAIFSSVTYAWDVIPKIKSFLLELSQNISDQYERIDEFIWVGKGTKIEKSAFIKGPAIIGCNCEIRHAAYLRENVIIGNEVVIGNSTEIKNSILFNNVQVPHFNFVGDSILGYRAHLGAGAITSNLKSTGELITVNIGEMKIETGLRKFGALLGDYAEIGCNSVLNPGTIIGRNCIVYPLTSVRGTVPEFHILKGTGEIVPRR